MEAAIILVSAPSLWLHILDADRIHTVPLVSWGLESFSRKHLQREQV